MHTDKQCGEVRFSWLFDGGKAKNSRGSGCFFLMIKIAESVCVCVFIRCSVMNFLRIAFVLCYTTQCPIKTIRKSTLCFVEIRPKTLTSVTIATIILENHPFSNGLTFVYINFCKALDLLIIHLIVSLNCHELVIGNIRLGTRSQWCCVW